MAMTEMNVIRHASSTLHPSNQKQHSSKQRKRNLQCADLGLKPAEDVTDLRVRDISIHGSVQAQNICLQVFNRNALNRN